MSYTHEQIVKIFEVKKKDFQFCCHIYDMQQKFINEIFFL